MMFILIYFWKIFKLLTHFGFFCFLNLKVLDLAKEEEQKNSRNRAAAKAAKGPGGRGNSFLSCYL